MVSILPDKERQKPLAYLLLLILLIAFYMMFVQGFVSQHLALNDSIGQMKQAEVRYRGAIARKPLLESRIAEMRRGMSQSNYFLDQTTVNQAHSELTTRLKETISVAADQSCELQSQQNQRSLDAEERFQRVTLKVRMRCEIDDLAKVLYELENSVPYLFADSVTLFRTVSRTKQGNQLVEQQALDVRFDLSGYIRVEDADGQS